VNRGFLNGPYCPIYGVGVVIVILLVFPLRKNMLLLYVVSVVLTSVLELVTGFALEKIFHYRWWNYSDVPFNIDGYVCLKFSLMWGIACIIVVDVIHPLVDDFVRWIPHFIGKILLGIMIVMMAIDLVATVETVLKLNSRLEKIDKIAVDIHDFSNDIGSKLTTDFLATDKKLKDLDQKKEDLLKKLDWGQRRMLKAFPTMKSSHHNESFKDMQNNLN
jgi:uncharacterized membrane protein